jgi:hypothetical protein
MVRNSQPAVSVDASDCANQPFMVMPTRASANADVDQYLLCKLNVRAM